MTTILAIKNSINNILTVYEGMLRTQIHQPEQARINEILGRMIGSIETAIRLIKQEPLTGADGGRIKIILRNIEELKNSLSVNIETKETERLRTIVSGILVTMQIKKKAIDSQ